MALRAKGNSILDSLPSGEFRQIAQTMECVRLPRDSAVIHPGKRNEYLYFPTTAVISFFGATGGGSSVEVWSVGHDGAAGILDLLGEPSPFLGLVQVPGSAIRAETAVLRKHFEKNNAFHDAALSYLQCLLKEISYLGICNHSHPLVQRLSRWLLVMEDRVGAGILNFTQDCIAGSLGTRRATISVAAAELQAAGLISYTPGAITIKSRRGLRKIACGCYRFMNLRA